MADKTYLHPINGMYEYQGVLYLPTTPLGHLETIQNFKFGNGDILVDTFSKSGTTWTQEILYLLHNGVNTVEAASKPIKLRVPFIDYNQMWSRATEMTPPRILKSHLRSNFFESELKKGDLKVVVTLRNPKDTLVSFYHFYQTNMAFGNFQGSWEDFFKIVQKKELIYGDWFDFTLDWWALRQKPNVLIIKYEDMKRSPKENIKKMAEFCNKEINEEQLLKIAEHTSFKSMKNNSSVNYANDHFLKKGATFMRTGITGGWKEYFTEEQNKYIDDLMEKMCEPVGLDFDYGE